MHPELMQQKKGKCGPKHLFLQLKSYSSYQIGLVVIGTLFVFLMLESHTKQRLSPLSYGSSPEYKLPKNFEFACPNVQMTSQHNEDKWMHNFWLRDHFKLDGIFVEIGAMDGKQLSNTWWLEHCLGWSGLLIEGHPKSAAQCQKNRINCIQSAVCTDPEGGVVQFIGNGGPVSGQVDMFPDDWARHKYPNLDNEERINVPCMPFNKILQQNGIAGGIDFWSLDVENAEMVVLKTHDWIQNPVHLLVMERAHSHDDEGKKRKIFLEKQCMEELVDAAPDKQNEIWINRNWPYPACSSRYWSISS